MLLMNPTVTHGALTSEYRVTVKTKKGTKDLWYRIPAAFGDMISNRADAAVVALAIPSMMTGGEMQVRGPLSEHLHYNMSRYVGEVIRRMNPQLARLRIDAETLQPSNGTEGRGVATGFSGGVDSFSVLGGHLLCAQPPGMTLTHLIFNDVGSHDLGSGGTELRDIRYNQLEPAAEAIGLPIIRVDSNLNEFYSGFDFQASHTMRNGSVALVLQSGIQHFLYGSTFSYSDIQIAKLKDIAYADPILLPLLSTECMTAMSADAHLSRVDKTLFVSQIELSHKYLDVCAAPGVGNCSACWKCRRTMLTLHFAGLLDRYDMVFDIPLFQSNLNSYIAEMALSKDTLLKEVRDFGLQQGFRIPETIFERAVAATSLRMRRFIERTIKQ